MTKLISLGRAALATAAFAAVPAMATNGYFTHGVGTHNKALAGAGDASPTQAIDVANNAASGVLMDESLDLGLAVFSPLREYTLTQSQLMGNFGAFSLGAGTVESDSNYFPIPYIAKNWRLSDTSALTVAFFGRGGMNTDYNSGSATFDPDGPGPAPIMTLPGTFGAGKAGVNLNQAFLEISYSIKVADNLALGIAPIFAYQMFEAEGVATFAPYTKSFAEAAMQGQMAMPQNLTNNGSDGSFGYGLKVGAIWQATDRLALQVDYQSKLDMDEFGDYADLFAQKGGFDIPAVARAGLSYAATDAIKLHFDIEQTYYNDVDSVGNPLTSVGGCPTAGMGGMNIENCLGGNQGFGFGWDDVTVYQVGLEWAMPNSNVTWRFGYNYGEQPISEQNAVINILALATVEEHYTAGLSIERENGHQLSFAIMVAPSKSVSGPNLFDPTQQVTLTMDQFEFEFAYTF